MVTGGARLLLAGLVLAAGILVPARPVRAESSPPLRSLDPLLYPDQPAGIKYGGLLYHASLYGGMAYDSNLFSSKENVVASPIQIIRPGLTISTLDPNYRFSLKTNMEHLEYDLSPADNRTDARAELSGTIRAQRDTLIDVGVSAARIMTPRDDIRRLDLPQDAANPVTRNQYQAWAALRQNLNPVLSTTSVAVENQNYFNVRSTAGPIIDLQYLDRDIMRVAQQFDLRLSHRLVLFTIDSVDTTIYRDVPGFSQNDSVKFNTLNGVEVGFTPLVRGRFTFRFAEEHFWDTTMNATPELAYAGELYWSPFRHLRLRAGVKRDFGGVNISLDSSGGRRTYADAAIEYDITRQLFFRATYTYLHANEASLSQSTSGAGCGTCEGSKRIQDTSEYRASIGYQMNRFWSLFLDYAFETREANIESDEFTRQVLQAGAIARF